MSTLYPVCVAHAHDRMPGDQVIAVTGRLILVSGCASVVGPLIGTILMALYGIDGVLYLLATAALLLAAFAGAGSWTLAVAVATGKDRLKSWRRRHLRWRTIRTARPKNVPRQIPAIR